jgi:calmodulin
MKGNRHRLDQVIFFIMILILELHEAFNLFDRDHSGSISSSELKQLLIALNFKPTESLLRKVMKEMDTDGM